MDFLLLRPPQLYLPLITDWPIATSDKTVGPERFVLSRLEGRIPIVIPDDETGEGVLLFGSVSGAREGL